jgi:hypothetical protein
MLTSIALVLMMTIPGLALFYGGMVRKKNMLATLAQSFGATCGHHRAVDDHRLFDRLHAASQRTTNSSAASNTSCSGRSTLNMNIRWRRRFPNPSTCSSR